MKITSGEYKYRKIEVPRGIRPTTEKVREAVFSMIAPWIPDAEVLDLFAGSGAMGLEALSRGAARCTFCEADRANSRMLLSNIANCGAGERALVYNRDFRQALSDIARRGIVMDAVIMDPPYDRLTYYEEALMLLEEYALVDDGSITVCEHLYDNKLPESFGNFRRIREKKYGTIGVDVFEYSLDADVL